VKARSRHQYRQGSGTALVIGLGAALVLEPANHPIVQLLERCLDDGLPFDAIVDELTQVGFPNLPHFALVFREGETVRLLQRGQIDVSFSAGDLASHTMGPPKSNRWREDVVEVSDFVRLTAVEQLTGQECWLTEGLVAANQLDWSTVEAMPAPGPDDVPVSDTASQSAPPRSRKAARASVLVDLANRDAAVVDPKTDIASQSLTGESGSGPLTVVVGLNNPENSKGSAESFGELRVDREPPGAESGEHNAVSPEPEGSADGSLQHSSSDGTRPDSDLLDNRPEKPEAVGASATVSLSSIVPDSPAARVSHAAPVPAAHGEVADLDFRNLMEQTIYTRVEDAAVRVESVDHSAATPEVVDPDPTSLTLMPGHTLSMQPIASTRVQTEDDEDHDGHTVARKTKPSVAKFPSPTGADLGLQVQAVICPLGHPNPVTSQTCRRCGQSFPNRVPHAIPRPQLGVLRFSTNQMSALDRPVLIGRAPQADRAINGEFPATLTIDNTELSRLHATVQISDWMVFVVDNDSTNGTSVITQGQLPQVCRPNEQVQIVPGSVVNLGGVASFRFDVE
jgi:FHA domain